MNNYIEYKDRIGFHPGCYLQELMEYEKLSQHEYAKRIGVSYKTMHNLLHAKASMTEDIAKLLFKYYGVSVQSWMNIQRSYDNFLEEMNRDLKNSKC